MLRPPLPLTLALVAVVAATAVWAHATPARTGMSSDDLQLTLSSGPPSSGQIIVETETRFTFSTTSGPKQLAAQLDEDLPPGTRLEVQVLSGAMSAGRRVLTRRSTSLAFHLPATEAGELRLRYRLVYDIHTPPGHYARNVTFTLLDQ